MRLIERRWASWRGRAVEPVVRESLELAAAAGVLAWPALGAVGAWWNRQFDPEVDLVGADRAPVARELVFVGSIKWLADPVDQGDVAALLAAGAQVPGYRPGHTGHVIVSRSGTASGLDTAAMSLIWGPADVLGAWPDSA